MLFASAPLTRLRSSPSGLTWPEALRRLEEFGPNELASQKPPAWPVVLWRALKHPMLVGVKTWAVAHLISNGDLGSIVLFGAVLAWAVFDRITLKRRTDAGAPAIPADGRRRDLIAIAVGTALYLVLGFIFHPLVVGVPVFGRPAF